MGVGDVLDPVLMASFPTQLDFAKIGVTNITNLHLVELYKANKKLFMIILLG